MHEGLSFQHYIFTLFNYKCDYPNLDERISIFRKYTLPSVLAQTEGRFKWLIVINPDHEPLFRDLDPRIILLHKESNLGKNFIEYINKDFASEYLITSRIDNDDLLRNDAFEIKVKNFQEDPGSKIIDSSGYRMNESGSKMVEFNMYGPKKNSPFSTAIKRIYGTITKQDTVYCTKHGILFTEFDNVVFLKERMWIQLIHSTNKVNRGMSGKGVNRNLLQEFLPDSKD